MGDVQVVRGGQDTTAAAPQVEFVEVVVDATGQTTAVPRDWLDSPVLGRGLTPVTAPPAVAPDQLGEAPTERNTQAEIDAFAADAGIDLGDAGTKAEKVAVIEAALAAAAPAPAAATSGNPDVQLVFGDASDKPLRMTTDQGGTEPSTETPATGDEEI